MAQYDPLITTSHQRETPITTAMPVLETQRLLVRPMTMDDLLHVAPDVLRHRLWTDAATVREKLRAVAMGAR